MGTAALTVAYIAVFIITARVLIPFTMMMFDDARAGEIRRWIPVTSIVFTVLVLSAIALVAILDLTGIIAV